MSQFSQYLGIQDIVLDPFELGLGNKKASVRMRVALEAPLDVVKRLLSDANKRVKRAAERRVKEGVKA